VERQMTDAQTCSREYETYFEPAAAGHTSQAHHREYASVEESQEHDQGLQVHLGSE
jgi:hypothetical protein